MKSIKKLVLVGLVLLASVVVLLPLVGCKSDVDPEVKEPPYLTFSAESKQTLTVSVYGNYTLDESLQYSVGGGEWKQLQADAVISFGGAAGDLRMRGKSSNGMAKGYMDFAYIVFGDDDVKVSCSGDIRTLVNYESPTTIDTSNARFSYLFQNCSVLTKAPALPAEKLADYCYYNMFAGCESLTSAPALDAKTLVPYCYEGMFAGCESLTSAPALDAETLVRSCYEGMFSGCTSLTSAPALPAKALVSYCYRRMFSGCERLDSVTMLATDIPAERDLDGWLENVSETGTFTMAATMDEITILTYIPSGWIVQNYDPQQ